MPTIKSRPFVSDTHGLFWLGKNQAEKQAVIATITVPIEANTVDSISRLLAKPRKVTDFHVTFIKVD